MTTKPAPPPAPGAKAPAPTNKRAELCDLADCITKLANTLPHPGVMDSQLNHDKLHGYAKRIKQIAQTV